MTQTCPFRDRVRFAGPSEPAIGARVVGLLALGRPSHIARRIRTIVIAAIERVCRRRSSPDVTKERVERQAPRRVHRNAPSAVVRVLLVGESKTSTLDAAPDVVFGRLGHAVTRPARNRQVTLATAARLCGTATQMRALHALSRTAITAADPFDRPVAAVATDDHEPSETLPRQVDQDVAHAQILCLNRVHVGPAREAA
jgi:hypothetical protein